MKQELIQATYDIIDEITSSIEYKRLRELQDIINQDPQLTTMIHSYKKAYIRYEEAKQYGTFHPDLKQRQKLFQEAKIALYSHDVVIEYKQLEQQIQSSLDHVSSTIAHAISHKIKAPNEIGLIPKH